MKTTSKILVAATAILALPAMTAHSALLLTFTESGGDVVLTYSGSVDMTNATWVTDTGLNQGGILNRTDTGKVEYNGLLSTGVKGGEFFTGVDLLAGDLTNGAFIGTPDAGNSGEVFRINGAAFQIGLDGFTAISNDNVMDFPTNYGPTGFVTFSGQSFASMGLDAHTPNTVIDLWAAQETPGSNDLVQFTVVPEPGSLALLGLGGLLITRRRRG